MVTGVTVVTVLTIGAVTVVCTVVTLYRGVVTHTTVDSHYSRYSSESSDIIQTVVRLK